MITKETIHQELRESLQEHKIYLNHDPQYYEDLVLTINEFFPIKAMRLRIPFSNKFISLIQFPSNLQLDYSKAIANMEYFLKISHINKGYLESAFISESPKAETLLVITESYEDKPSKELQKLLENASYLSHTTYHWGGITLDVKGIEYQETPKGMVCKVTTRLFYLEQKLWDDVTTNFPMKDQELLTVDRAISMIDAILPEFF